MDQLFKTTSVYRAITLSPEAAFSQAVLVVFPDPVYLRALLKECAKAFFKEGDERRADLIDRERFPDLHLFPESGKAYSVDLCTEIIEESLLQPTEEKSKLFVLDGFQDAPMLIQNKLLKLLEEPPEQTAFLIGATSEYALLPTVLSRVKKFSIAPFPEEALKAALRRKYPTQPGTREAAAGSGGVFSTAERLLCNGGEDFRLAEEFLSLRESERFCRNIGERDSRSFFAALNVVLRDMLFLSAGQKRFSNLSGDGILKLAEEYPQGALIAALELSAKAENEVRFHANFGTCLYALALDLKKEKEKWKKWS